MGQATSSSMAIRNTVIVGIVANIISISVSVRSATETATNFIVYKVTPALVPILAVILPANTYAMTFATAPIPLLDTDLITIQVGHVVKVVNASTYQDGVCATIVLTS
jgi:hypothetical protein